MDEKRKEFIIEKAKMCRLVLAQVPMMLNVRARDAGNIVWWCCRHKTCLNKEEEEVWDEVFEGMMPMAPYDADTFGGILMGDDPKNKA